MTSRLAVLALLLGVGLLLGYLGRANKGPFASAEGRHLRAMKDRRDAPAHFVPFTFQDFEALPHERPLAEYAPLERKGVSLVGFARWMSTSMDGDFHLDLSTRPEPLTNFQARPVTGEFTAWWRRGSTRWRWDRLAAELRPHAWGVPDWPEPPRRVRVSGWLMYDFEYDAPYGKPRQPIFGGEMRGRRLTGWEIHPITRLELWDDSLHRFVEYPR